ncbi:hypothetical protein CLAFUW4_00047 [Fulvia fulva]|uniref:Uncharacterized protein n=1 Tax=Passalora fulva TaxID=5499 RepID=A0A9Q8L637_PASFU|nr:uncharacterized protein CLAFUR5_00046 [Fulvia fulva]KAK4635584.1 hypothetical protein CLAFUR4_00046 [Fulvia fulva]KAK4637876.1 hypothetical protein CLAFUR0_00045 [Fulvia fulva]UJO11494.1 hypothetical protein CLAFUR5_00046 [Fulvia fulva]WPV09507.1 hypothetical protein CLAFUW4_00047 [Fulvia fulva]WPV24986.1 hypothetical protein CLAFUW7_00047 [Fulvia fulva]
MSRWPIVLLQRLLDIFGLILVGLVILSFPITHLLHVIGFLFGSFFLDLWREHTHEPSNCWNKMVVIPPDPTIPPPLPPPQPPQKPRPLRTREDGAYHLDERKRQTQEDERRVLQDIADAEEKAWKAWWKKNKGGMWSADGKKKARARKVFAAAMEALRQEKPFDWDAKINQLHTVKTPVVQTPTPTVQTPITTTQKQSFGPAAVGQVQVSVKRLQHYPSHWMFSETSDRQTLYRDATLAPGYLSSRQLGELLSGPQKQISVFNPLLNEPSASFSCSKSSAAHQKMVQEYGDFIWQHAQSGQSSSARQRGRELPPMVKQSTTTFSTSHESKAHLKVVARYGNFLRAPSQQPQGSGQQDSSNGSSTDSGGDGSGASQNGPTGNAGKSLFDRITAPDPPKQTFASEGWTKENWANVNFNFGASSGAGTQPSGSTAGMGSPPATAGASGAQWTAASKNPILMEPTLEKQRTFVSKWINGLRTNIATGKVPGSVDTMSPSELTAYLATATEQLTHILGWCAPEGKWRTARVSYIQAKGTVGLSSDELDSVNSKLNDMSADDKASDKDLDPCIIAMEALISAMDKMGLWTPGQQRSSGVQRPS